MITIKSKSISKGFVIAGLMNMSVLIFSKFFTNSVIPEFDSIVMSNFGLVMIVMWGLAYMAIAKNYQHVKWLIAVFAIEKLIYGVVWVKWLFSNSLSGVYTKDTLAGMFYTVYGFNDLLFFVFFTYVFISLKNKY